MSVQVIAGQTLAGRRPPVIVIVATALVLAVLPGGVEGQQRWGDNADPVLAAVDISQRSHTDGAATFAVLGRDDVFADNLAATPLAGPYGTILFTDGGEDQPLRPAVLTEIERALGPGEQTACEEGRRADVYVLGGTAAVSAQAEQTLVGAGYCVRRLAGATRVETSVAIADEVGPLSGQVLLARGDSFADAAAVSSYAAMTNARLLITPSGGLPEVIVNALTRYAPTEIVLLGGESALSPQVQQQAAAVAPTRRVAGDARDATAVAIADELWPPELIQGFAVGHGWASTSWGFLFAFGPYGSRWGMPVLYATSSGPTAATRARTGGPDDTFRLFIGPERPVDVPEAAPPPSPTETATPAPTSTATPTPAPTTAPGVPEPGDLSRAAVRLDVVGTYDSPLAMRPRPGGTQIWVAERAGVIRTLQSDPRVVLDISDTVSTNGERGLLGFAFSPDGDMLYTSSTDRAGDSVLDAFEVDGTVVDVSSRRQLLRIDQPASNHNGGDLHTGPDGMLWWALGDGGGANDQYGNGQRADTLLGTILRIDPGPPLNIPPDNPFVDGGGAPEVWAYGLRNPWRIAFDPLTDDLYIADVGQDQREEIDVVSADEGGGSNFGWPIFEGTAPFAGGQIDAHVPPVHEIAHADGNCAITGGVVYRGSVIDELQGAYLYTDLCNTEVRGIVVHDGQVTQAEDLGVRADTPIAFGVDHQGEVYVISLGGTISKIVPA